jgi:hypothetical protein
MGKSPSPLGRLLEEISWEGNARHYREGGRGFENVLTAEVLQAIDFLPRKAFLGRILESLPGEIAPAARLLGQEVEELSFSLLPGGFMLEQSLSSIKSPLEVQPDAIVESPSVLCLLEAKRIKRGAFQPEQLAREFIGVVQKARSLGRRPLLLLLLPKEPPVSISGMGRLEIHEAVSRSLGSVLERTEEATSPEDLLKQLHTVVAYTTWPRISECLTEARRAFTSGSPSIDASIGRLTDAALGALTWHG